MSGAVPAFDLAEFKRGLSGPTMLGRRTDHHDSVTSTMTLADERVRAEGGAAHGSVIVADMQTVGLGRRGRSWQSGPLGNLYFSLIWAPPALAAGAGVGVAFAEMAKLNLAAGVAVVGASRAVGITSTRIKWPNDVWGGPAGAERKLSGTLLDFDGRSSAVLGVGINVLQDLSSNATATSLASLAASGAADAPPISREAVLATFCNEVQRLMLLPTAEVLAEYAEHDLLRGRTIRVHHKTREEDHPDDFDAEALGVDGQGMLRVRRLDGNRAESALSGEEVSIGVGPPPAKQEL
jgi:BirA family biotin operon repressor/biotin-[acetyl-CoA-carboxylase] ligase